LLQAASGMTNAGSSNRSMKAILRGLSDITFSNKC
jgi:hypothetical protein